MRMEEKHHSSENEPPGSSQMGREYYNDHDLWTHEGIIIRMALVVLGELGKELRFAAANPLHMSEIILFSEMRE